jgi:hypothetical protein
LEYSLGKIPIFGKIFLTKLKPLIVNKFPNLTLYHYVIEARKS